MKMLILTFKDHSIKRQRTNPLYSVAHWGAVGRQSYTPGTRSAIYSCRILAYSFKMSPKIAISMNDTDYAK